jgi:outer membrane protein assembly factor BamB
MRLTQWARPPLVLVLAAVPLLGLGARADDWPHWGGPQRDGVWREKGILDKFPKGGPKALWCVPVGGGYAGPAVAGGRVYVADRVLDPGQKDPANPFTTTNSKGKERLLCLDQATGKLLWKDEYDVTYRISYPCGPRATPAVAGGKVYTVGAMGDLRCVDDKGKLVWSKNFVRDYKARLPIWGFAGPPLVDGDRVICMVGGKDGAAVVAFDKDTGKEKWRALDLDNTDIGYAPPVIVSAGGKRQLIAWHPESVNGLDPQTGKAFWSQPFRVKANMTIPTPILLDGDKLFVTCFYSGCRLYQLSGGERPAATLLYKSKGRSEQPKDTDMLHCVMSTPVYKDGYLYGICSYGQMRCLDAKDGKRVWEDLRATDCVKELSRWANAFIVPQGDRYFLFNEHGDLIIARLSPKGYQELDRANLLAPTGQLAGGRFGGGRKVVWSHPAFAGQAVFARNDKEVVCYSLAAGGAR